MKNLHIENSYNIWDKSKMRAILIKKCLYEYDSVIVSIELNRSYKSMYIEWWLHNIGYYITKPFCFIELIRKINVRFRDVDINEWID